MLLLNALTLCGGAMQLVGLHLSAPHMLYCTSTRPSPAPPEASQVHCLHTSELPTLYLSLTLHPLQLCHTCSQGVAAMHSPVHRKGCALCTVMPCSMYNISGWVQACPSHNRD